ncbi:hypothetical protein EHS13_08340 [Paenibacillus psychroresistens]|uniref:SLH domain-containing protein n=1 Tax=Paenibacillus psychroresistens TaxID=1778678 RepID=A0A6B8RH11_9BACL|nr:S-layer homology domain-containing protein [Paenibacillus psychroresistens]QGQ94885.1 hypothetical protein EHS13_08340 [Paenibacillus psychroresistens]
MLKRLNAIVLIISMLIGLLGLGIMPANKAYAENIDTQVMSTKDEVVNGFEQLSQWAGEATTVAETVYKTEGAQSAKATFAVSNPANGNAWSGFYWEVGGSHLDLSEATQLKIDIRPVGVQTAGEVEPLHFKLEDSVGGVLYEDILPVQNANEWNTFNLDLSSISSANRASITYVVFYVFNQDASINGRTSLQYMFDNVRAVKPAAMIQHVVDGFEDLGKWGFDAGLTPVAETIYKTEGNQSLDITFPVPTENCCIGLFLKIPSPYVDMSGASQLKFDIRPVGSQSMGSEPIRFKLQDKVDGHVIYEDVLPVMNANEWNTFTLDLSNVPVEERSSIEYIVFYVFNEDSGINGRTSLHYMLDNVRMLTPIVNLTERVVNGFEDMSQWGFDEGLTPVTETVYKTEGNQSLDITFPVPTSNCCIGFFWKIPSPFIDMSGATKLKFDIRPVGSQSVDKEPIRFKLQDKVDGHVIYEDVLPAMIANEWNTFTLDLSNVPVEERSSIEYIVFYVFNGDASIGGRTTLHYMLDNIRILSPAQIQPVTATPGASAVLPGTPVSLATETSGASIFYTLDGTDPRSSASKIEYNGPITIEEVTLIKAYAEMEGFGKSAVSNFQFNIGTGVPGEEIYKLNSNVGDIGDSVLAGINKTTHIDQNGYMDDWSGQASFKLPSNISKQVIVNGWAGDADLSANVALAYDDNNLLVHVKVKDNVQSDFSNGDIWMGDSVQVAFSKDGTVYGPEYGFSYGQGTASKFSWNSGSAKLGVDSIKFKSSRDEGTKETTYDISIPWLAVLPVLPGEKVPFTLIVNDNDGNGRKGYIEWTPGIGNGKNATTLGSLILLQPTQTWSTGLYGPQKTLEESVDNYYLSLPNFGTDDIDFALSVPAANLTIDHLIVPAGKVLKKAIPVTFHALGNQEVKATLTENGTGIVKEAKVQVAVSRNDAGLNAAFDDLNARLPILEGLLSQAKAKNIPVDYETVNYTVIKNFIQYGKDDVASSFTSRADYVATELEKLFQEAETNLNAYLSGQKTALAVPRYVTGATDIEGYSFMGAAKTSVSDVIQNRPIFFTGYGHFNQAKADIPKFSDYGTNIIQMEIGPDGTVLAPEQGSDADFSISTTNIEDNIIPYLQNADDHNIAVSLLLSPHYFPAWAKTKWPDLANSNEGFLNYNVNAPKAREIVKAFIDTIVPLVKDHPSLHSIILTNEPKYDTRKDSFAVTPWHEFLEHKYSDIGSLNDIYGTDFTLFNEVAMPNADEATPLYYDWTTFNNDYFASWHEWMAGLVKELAPELPVSTKIMGNLNGVTTYGVDPEDFSKFSDINGNDNWNYLGNGAGGFLRENRFYDLQTSLKKAPVFNSETHVIADRDSVFTPEQAEHVETSMWQAAVHGRTASTVWVWERTNDATSDLNGSVLNRPDVVKTIGKLNLDLNRLAYEVTALQNITPQSAILYSLPSMVYTNQYLDTLDKAYEALTYNGQKVGFVSEKQTQIGGLNNYKLLIIPQATHVGAATLLAIKSFVAAGGKVIVIGNDALSFDENNKPLNAADRSAILSNSIVKDASMDMDTLKQTVRDELKTLGLMQVVLKDKSTGLPIDGVEWLSTEYNGKLLINFADYDSSSTSKNFNIEVNGKSVGTANELINGGTMDTNNITATLEKPYLISVNLNNGGGSTTPTNPVPAVPTIPVVDNGQKEFKDNLINVTPKLENGKAIAAISLSDFSKALENVKTDSQGESTVSIEIKAVDGTKEYVLQLPATLFNKESEHKNLEIKTPEGSVILPLNMFSEAETQGVKTIELSIASADASKLSNDIKQRIGSRPVVEISFNADGKVLHWNNPDVPVAVSIAYTPSKEELGNLEHIVVWYIDGTDAAIPVPNAQYDAATGMIVFTTTHFSKYAVAYNFTSFSDAAKFKWAQQSIEVMTSKGILNGTKDAALFNPDRSITRDEFMDALVKTLGISAKFDTNFSDLNKSDTFYNSIGIAKKLGITLGTGENKFNPGAQITRQEMAVFLVRALKIANKTLADGTENDLKIFTDAPKIASYAKEYMADLVKDGILVGDGHTIIPLGHLTKAQAAVVLYRIYNKN